MAKLVESSRHEVKELVMRAEIKMKIKSESNLSYPRKCAQIKGFTTKLSEKKLLLQPPKIYVYTSILNYFSLLYT